MPRLREREREKKKKNKEEARGLNETGLSYGH